jgi:SET domain-containing protein
MSHVSLKGKPFRIGRSRTGLGLFATKPIRKRALVVEYSGRLISTRTANEKERLKANKYLFEINKSWTIDGATRTNLARYVNHACRPNTEAELVRGRMMYRARRAIVEGEEITVDYGREYFNLYLKDGGCLCVSCRERRRNKRRTTGRKKKLQSPRRQS